MLHLADCFIWGKRGSGKSLFAVLNLYVDWFDGRQIWANCWLHPAFSINKATGQTGNYVRVNAYDLINLLIEESEGHTSPLLEKYQDVQKTLFIDEAKGQAGKFSSPSFVTRKLVDFVSQARKRKFQIIWADQVLNAMARDLRGMTEDIWIADAEIDQNDLGLGNEDYPEPLFFNYYRFNIDQQEITKEHHIRRHIARYLYPLYHTEEMITPIDLQEARV